MWSLHDASDSTHRRALPARAPSAPPHRGGLVAPPLLAPNTADATEAGAATVTARRRPNRAPTTPNSGNQ